MVRLRTRALLAWERRRLNDLDRLLVGRIERALSASGDSRDATLRAVRDELYRSSLTVEEEAARRGLAEGGAEDPLGGLLSLRIAAALAAGHAASDDATSPASVLVLRRRAGAGKESIDTQVATALSRVRDRLKGEGAAGDSTLFLLAHETAFQKLRRFLPTTEQSRIVFFTREETARGISEPTLRDVEVVEADSELAPLESHLAGLLGDDVTGDTPGVGAGDSMTAEMIGMETDSMAETIATGTAAAGVAPAAGAAPVDRGDDDPLLGTLFHKKYRILRKIGVGGFGAVYEARDERGAGNRVAIKVLHVELAQNDALVRAFRNEARRMTRLSHPGIVDWKVFDETDEGIHYFVMELVEGMELDRVLVQEGPLPWRRVATMVLQTLDALRAAHHLGESESVLHLDLKPRNVFVVPPAAGRPERIKVIDFGIGQYVGEDEDDIAQPELPELEGALQPELSGALEDTFNPTTIRFARIDDDRQRGFRRCTGCTPEYASPEQCAHVLELPDIDPLDGRSDLYSLGVMAFQMLTGELPFSRPLVRTDFLRLHLERTPKKVASMGVPVSRKLARFIDRCLEKNPNKRFRDTNEAYDILDKIVHPPVGKLVVMAGVPLLLVAVAFGSMLFGRREKETAWLSAGEVVLNEANSLYVGPERREIVLTTRTDALAASGDCTLVDAETGEPQPGWEARWEAPGRVRLTSIGEQPSERSKDLVQLVFERSTYAFKPFTLVWVGAGSWEFETIAFNGTRYDDLDGRAVDPSGMFLEVRLKGEELQDVDTVKVEVLKGSPGESPGADAKTMRRVDDRMHSIELVELECEDGTHDVGIWITDWASRSKFERRQLMIESDALEITGVQILNAATDGEPSQGNMTGDRFLITEETEPVVRLTTNRSADVVLSIFSLERPEQKQLKEDKGRREYPAIKVSQLIRGLEEAPTFAGTIQVVAEDGAYVLHASTSQGGEIDDEVGFFFDRREADFNISLGGKELTSLRRHVGGHELNLSVGRVGDVPMKVVVSAKRVAGGHEDASEIVLRGTRQGSVSLTLGEDGMYEIDARAFRYTSQREEAEKAESVRTYTIVLLSGNPLHSIGGIAEEGLVFNSLEELPEIRVDFAEETTLLSSVTASYALVASDGARTELEAIGDDRGARLRLADSLSGSWPVESNEHDGVYFVSVEAFDEADNTASLKTRPFTVSLNGPEIDLREPRGTSWPNTARIHDVKVMATDNNGVKSVECQILLTEDAVDGESVPLALSVADSTPTQSIYEGQIELDQSWSEREVWLRFTAVDEAGTERVYVNPQPKQLKVIEPTIYERLAAAEGRGPMEDMHLIPARAGVYLFGGRGDDTEERLFEQARLPAPEKSWGVTYEDQVGGFYLDEHEVSVGQYLVFLSANGGGLDPQRHAELTRSLLAIENDELPVTGITWDEASAYAAWAGKRLPSLVEWEYAVRGGPDYRPFPWWGSGEVDVLEAAMPLGEPGPRGIGPDVTPDTRIRNLCTNVAEWVANPLLGGNPDLAGHPDERTLLDPRLLPQDVGRSAYWIVGALNNDARYHFFAARTKKRTYMGLDVGFRCALSMQDARKQVEQGLLREVSQ